MVIHINFLAVVLAGVSSMIIGAIYYSDSLLGKEWKKLSKINTKQFEKDMVWNMSQLFIGALITSYTVAFVTCLYHYYYHSSWLLAGVASAIVLFVGVSATTVAIHDTMNQIPTKLINITFGNRFLSILAMGLIIGWLHP
jgi:hypothetical protein